jgi:hypothetical protein
MKLFRNAVVLAALLALAPAGAADRSVSTRVELLIRNGVIYDGTGGTPFNG